MMATAPPTIQERIAVAAPNYEQLRQTLSETEYAVPALYQITSQISNLDKQITAKKAEIAILDSKLEKEQVSHQKYRDSTLRRVVYNATGRKSQFADLTAKEEQHFLRTRGDHAEATRCLLSCYSELSEAKKMQAETEDVKRKHATAQDALDVLYDSIFEGPTEAFPHEDVAELAVAEARRALTVAQQKLRDEEQVQGILKEANVKFIEATRSIQEASRIDLLLIGDHYRNYKERHALRRTKASVEQIKALVTRAQGIIREVENLGPLKVPEERQIWNNFHHTEKKQLRVIEDCERQVLTAAKKLRGDLSRATLRINNAMAELELASVRLHGEIEGLRKIRCRIIDSVVGGLPEYDALEVDFKTT